MVVESRSRSFNDDAVQLLGERRAGRVKECLVKVSTGEKHADRIFGLDETGMCTLGINMRSASPARVVE